MNEIVHKGFSREVLKSVFDKVCDLKDWKNPIEVDCTGEMVMVAVAAIEFFCGATPEVLFVPNRGILAYHISSPGYYEICC